MKLFKIKSRITCLIAVITALAGYAENRGSAPAIANPIIAGFAPDPGLLRVQGDYYIVTSSFEYFPCFPIYHSKDLVHWKLIGNVLSRPSQIDLEGVGPSDGIFSPVMRYFNETYYLTYTLLKYTPEQHILNYVVTAKAPQGPWSDPTIITNDSFWRIDSSLFMDDDGKCYFTANSYKTGDAEKKSRVIVLQEFDLKTLKLVGEKHEIGSGASPDSRTAEGAHIYKRDGYYYLLIAEGGTGVGHAVTISRSRAITGPYEQCPIKPLLSHRDLPKEETKIWGVGHGEIIETQNGESFMALLGTRGVGVLGRETFLIPVQWKTGEWPILAPGSGQVEPFISRPQLTEFRWPEQPAREMFNGPELSPDWLFIRVPADRFWSFTSNPGNLRLKLLPATHNNPVKTGSPAFVGKRLGFHNGQVTIKMNFTPREPGEAAGLLLHRGKNAISACEIKNGDELLLQVRLEEAEGSRVVGQVRLKPGPVIIKAECKDEVSWTISCSQDASTWTIAAENVDGSLLGTKAPGGVYTGTVVGLYATSQGKPTENSADFVFFESHANGDR